MPIEGLKTLEGPATSASRSDANVPSRGSNVPRSSRPTSERIENLRGQFAIAAAAHTAANAAITPAQNDYTHAMRVANENVVDEDTINAQPEEDRAAFIRAAGRIL